MGLPDLPPRGTSASRFPRARTCGTSASPMATSRTPLGMLVRRKISQRAKEVRAKGCVHMGALVGLDQGGGWRQRFDSKRLTEVSTTKRHGTSLPLPSTSRFRHGQGTRRHRCEKEGNPSPLLVRCISSVAILPRTHPPECRSHRHPRSSAERRQGDLSPGCSLAAGSTQCPRRMAH